MGTVYDYVVRDFEYDWTKHGPFEGYRSVEDYIEGHLQTLSRTEFLLSISDAIESRLLDIKE